MRLEKLILRNFRCYGDEPVVIPFSGLTTFIGANSSGKTAVLAALQKLFSPIQTERILQRSDFHVAVETAENQRVASDLSIEAVFLFERFESDDVDCEHIPAFFENVIVSNSDNAPKVRIRMIATFNDAAGFDGDIDQTMYFVKCPEGEKEEETDLTPVKGSVRKLIQFLYVPAVRNPTMTLRNMSGSLMNRMLHCVCRSTKVREEVRDLLGQVSAKIQAEPGIQQINDSVANNWGRYRFSKRFATASIRFDSFDSEEELNHVDIAFSPSEDGRTCPSSEIGDGMRSLFHIALADSVLDIYEKMREEQKCGAENHVFQEELLPALTILAIEEPENHIAPQLLGKTVANLCSISGKKCAQVVISSHSPSIVARVDPRSIRHFWVDTLSGTGSVSILRMPEESVEDEYKYVANAVRAYPELYFAKAVVLCEGASEQVILPRVFRVLSGMSVDDSGIAIVPLGGRHVNHFWRLLNGLHIPYVTLLDLDSGRFGGGFARIKYALEHLISNNIPKDSLLLTPDGNIIEDTSTTSLESVDGAESLQYWLHRLEKNDVFYSAPLDVDFMMLEKFKDSYKGILSKEESPVAKTPNGTLKKIVEIEVSGEGIPASKIEKDVIAVLGGGDEGIYSEDQKALMVWYRYLFLGRGKPSVHIASLSNMSDDCLKEHIPEVFRRLHEALNSKLA